MLDFTCDTNYLAPTRFKVLIDRENYPSIQFFAQQIQHPSMDMNATEQSYRRISSVVMPGDTINHGTLTMEVLLDENMKVYEEIYEWMKRLVETKHNLTAKSLLASREALSSYSDISISVLTSHNNIVRSFKYKNALPVTLGDVAFAATSEEQFLTCPVTFAFDYFEFI